MTPRDELLALAERAKAATEPDRELDTEIVLTLCPGATVGEYAGYEDVVSHGQALGLPDREICPFFTASLDAAMTLVPAGWNWMAGNHNHPNARAYVENGEPAFYGGSLRRNPRRQWFEVVAATPALALTAACLLALAAQEPEHD